MPEPNSFQAGAATIRLKNIQIPENVLLDEVSMEGDDIHLDLPATSEGLPQIRTGEVRFRATVSEPNLNRALETLLPPDGPVRNLRIAVFSGKVEFRGQYVKSVLSLPFTLEAIPVIENGIRLFLDCKAAKASGIGLPPAVVEVVEKALKEKITLDLSQSPIPVWLEEIRCEPGRLTAVGKGRIIWPPAPQLDRRPMLSGQAEGGSHASALPTL